MFTGIGNFLNPPWGIVQYTSLFLEHSKVYSFENERSSTTSNLSFFSST